MRISGLLIISVEILIDYISRLNSFPAYRDSESHHILSFEWHLPLSENEICESASLPLSPPSPPASPSHQQGLKVIPLSCCQSKLTWFTIFHNNYLKLRRLVIKVILAPWWHIQHDKTEVMWQQQNLSALFTHCFSALFCWVTDLSLNYRRATELN